MSIHEIHPTRNRSREMTLTTTPQALIFGNGFTVFREAMPATM
jgi:hypothetical protein